MKKIHLKNFPGLSIEGKDAAEIHTLLLREEYRAERIISISRVIFYFLALMEILIVSNFSFGSRYQSMRLPFFFIFLFSIAMMIDTLFLGKERYYKYFNFFTKYYIISVDFILASVMIYYIITRELFSVSGSWALSLFFISMSAILVPLSIFRHSAPAGFYSGIASMAAFIIMAKILNLYQSVPEIFIQGNSYLVQNAMYFWTTISVTILSVLISIRTRSIMIRSKRQERLERFLPETIAQEIVLGTLELKIGGNRETCTILFSDIRNFTGISEKMEPEGVIDLLNSYFTDMIDIIFKNHGALDKTMGDGIMAIFGGPFSKNSGACEAVQAAVEMQQKLVPFNEIRKLNMYDPIKIGIGIHSGDVIMGNVGNEKRMDFTVIGDTVNTASRLEGLTKKFQTPIIISGETRKNLNGNFQLKDLDAIAVKGKEKPVQIFAIEGW